MPTEMLDRLQENKLQGLDELIDSWEGADAAGGGKDQAAAIADFLVDEGIGVRQGLLRHWDYYWKIALSSGPSKRREDGKNLRSLLERGSRGLARCVVVARIYADVSGHEVARLGQLEEQSRTFPLWVEECMARWELLDRPRKPLDRERLAKARAAFERGECEPVADVLARLDHETRPLPQ